MGNSNTIELRLTVKDDGSVVIKQFTGQGTKNLQQLEKSSEAMSNRMGGGLQQLRQHWLAFTAAIAGAIAFAKKAIDHFLEQEKAENALAVAMRNYGDYTEKAHKELLAFAADMQKLTTYGDEQTISVMANLKAYGMNTEELKRATKASMDLATAKKMDLWAASELVGKAFVGETGTLSRYGIIVDDNIERGEKFAAVIKLINERFGGSAQAEIETYGGQLKQIGNWWGDILEKIGYGLIKALEAVMGAMGWVTAGLMTYISLLAGGFSNVFALLGHLPGKAGEVAREISASLRSVSDDYKDQAATSMEFAMKHFAMLTADAKNTQGAINQVHDRQQQLTDAQKKALGDYEKLHEQVTSRIKELTLDETDFKIWQLNKWYEESVQAYQKAGKDTSELARLYALEKADIQRAALADWLDLHQKATDRIEQLSVGEKDYKLYQLNEWYQKSVAIYEKAGKDITELTRQYNLEQAAIVDEANKKKQEEQQKYADEWMTLEHAITSDLATEVNKRMLNVEWEYEARLKQIEHLKDVGALSEQAYTQAVADAVAARDKLLKEAEKQHKNFDDYIRAMNEQTAQNMQQSLSDLFFNTMKGNFNSFEDWFSSFCDSIEKIWSDTLAKMVSEWLLQQMSNLGGGSTGGGFAAIGGSAAGSAGGGGWVSGIGNILTGLLGAILAEGGVLHRGRIHPFASGTIVTGPTIFPMAEGYGLMGEKGYEAVMPLARTPQGDLGVKATAGAGGKQIVLNGPFMVVNTPNADSFRKTEGQIMAEAALALNRWQRNL